MIKQGVPFETIHMLKAVAQEPYVVKPNVFERQEMLFNFQKIVHIFQLFLYNFLNKLSFKHILVLPT